MHRITLIPGDGIGPEVASNVVRIIEASGVEIQWETHYAGAQALEKFGETLPQDLLESIKRNKVALKGPITTPIGKGFTSVNVGLRKTLDFTRMCGQCVRCRMCRVAIRNSIWS